MYKQDTPATLLIVDDLPANVQFLFKFLKSHGFKVIVASDGQHALKLLENGLLPDLILLDILMANMNGFDTFQKIKAIPTMQLVPIIFMTALSQIDDKLKGFKLGAVDYITKPLQQEDVLARIQAHLSIQRLYRDLEEKNAELARKNADLNLFADTIAHDLRNSLNVTIGHSRNLKDFVEQHELNSFLKEPLGEIYAASMKMTSIINSLLLLAQAEDEEIPLEWLNMQAIIDQVLQRLRQIPHLHYAEATIELPPRWLVAFGYAAWVEEVWFNYLSNALKYSGKSPHIVLGCCEEETHQRFWVRDNGQGISVEMQNRLFKPFVRARAADRQRGSGLGLSIVERIVTRLNGKVGLESAVGQGSLFYFTLPKR